MKTNNRISARAMLAMASLAFSPAAWSLGLGDAQVESYLNQPLKARIDLVSKESDDLASVTAKLASADDYELIGASLEDIPVPVRFTIEDIGGDAYLMATSQLPIGSPIVRLIVEVNWASGRMLREYTLFLDPPTLADQAPPPRIDTRSKAPQPAPVPETAPASEPPTAVSEADSEPARAESRPAQPESVSEPTSERVPASGEYGPVASGETLWGIATDWSRGTGMSVNQVMIAIQRENPNAFLNNNINLLKRGAILRMPSVSAVESISSAAAFNEVVAQEEEFTGRQSIAMAASPSMPLLSDQSAAPPVDEAAEETEQSSYAQAAEELAGGAEEESEAVAETETETEAVAEEPAAPVAEGSLELVPPSEASELDSTYGFEETDDNGDASMAAQALRENLARAEEDLITQQQQNAYLEERIKDLEAQLAENEEANVADSDMANMEQRLREERQAATSPAAEEPWYSRFSGWLIGLVLAIAALIGWRLRRRGGASADAGAGETIQEITGEAEEVLRVLEDEQAAADEPAADTEAEDHDESEAEAGAEAEPEQKAEKKKKSKAAFGSSDDDAEVLDEESSDPEIQLDLARAYISMGDKEAARVILEEVVSNGSEEQQSEAQKMLDLM